jgi:hypothetical protein
MELGRRLASIQQMQFAGLYPEKAIPERDVYLLPTDTLIGIEHALGLGVKTERQIFGGVAPHAFIPTKAITHALYDPDAKAPHGWSNAFAMAVHDSVLRGGTAFSLQDALRVGDKLLLTGPIRLKPVHATAGRGQVLITRRADLEDALHHVDLSRITECGLVLEEHLEDVRTYSVGQIRVAGLVASYVGTQSLTADNQGENVYGGSDLLVVRGDFDQLLALDLPPSCVTAITKARVYDHAATQHFPGFFASRRNYDVASGKDAQGKERWGVLEQSWRVGGASAAEIFALERFHLDPQCQAVHASTTERFGDNNPVPQGSILLFDGIDPKIGHLKKYVRIDAHGH